MPFPTSTLVPKTAAELLCTVAKSKSNIATRFFRPCVCGAPDGAAAAGGAAGVDCASAPVAKNDARIKVAQMILFMFLSLHPDIGRVARLTVAAVVGSVQGFVEGLYLRNGLYCETGSHGASFWRAAGQFVWGLRWT